MTRTTLLFVILAAATALLFAVDVAAGAVSLSLSQVWAALTGGDCAQHVRVIVTEIRLPKAVVAIAAGAALAVSGLQMQTLFRNPLAGPYVLGVNSGASLGVALFVLGAPVLGLSAWTGALGMAGAAWIGAAVVLGAAAVVGARVRDIMVILILGMMFSSAIGAAVQILQYLSRDEALKSFVVWTMGSLGNVTSAQMPVFAGAVILGLVVAVLTVKPLNMLLFGEDYACTMGLDIRRSRMLIFTSTTLLAGTVTAFCGPIGFVGLAVPHVMRRLFATARQGVLIAASALGGAVLLLVCDIFSKQYALPVNALTALLGIPVVVWVVMRSKKGAL